MLFSKLKYTFLFIIIFLFKNAYSHNIESPTPSLKKPMLEEQQEDTVQVRLLIEKAEEYINKDIDTAVFYIQQAGKLARKLKAEQSILTYLSIHVKILDRQSKYKEALKLAKEGIVLSKKTKKASSIAVAYNNVGNQYSNLGILDKATSHYLTALKIAEKEGLLKLQQKFCNNLSSVFLELREKEQSFKYAKRSYDLAIKTKDNYAIASSLVNLANSEVINGKLDQGITYLKDLIKVGEKLDDITYLLDAYINSGHVATEQKEYEAALNYFLTAKEKLKDDPLPDYQLYINWGIAQSYFHLKSYDKAKDYVTKSIKLGESIEALHEMHQLYQLASEIHEHMGNTKLALNYHKKFQLLNDSLLNAETRENINKLEIEYQTSQKEKALAEQKLVIAKNEIDLQVKNKWILVTCLVAVILAFITGNIFLIYKHKQKVNAERLSLLEKEKKVQVLEAMMSGEEKERSRLAKELHDGIGGILSATKMHLSILKNDNPLPERATKFDDTLGMLDSAFKEIRAIAHNLAPEILLKHGLDKALLLYCDRISNEKLSVEYYSIGDIPRLQSNYELIIYRVVQELMNNIIKHSEASNAFVQLTSQDNFMTLTVEDNGIGMEETESNGIGMINLRSRIDALKGDLNIVSEKGKGTTFYIEFEASSFLIESEVEQYDNLF